MRPGLSLLAALGLTMTTVSAPVALAQGTTAESPAAVAAQGRDGERGTDGRAAVRPPVARARLMSTENPFLRGQVLMRQTGANQTAVIVTVYGLDPGSEHVNHIHNGSCTGNILFPLEKLIADEAGVARSVSSVPGAINLDTWWVNVHAGYSLPSPGITCGQIEGPPPPRARSGDAPAPRPEGGDRPSAPPAGAPPPTPERR